MKSQHTTHLLLFILVFCFSSLNNPSKASHNAGGEISYIHLGGNQYLIQATLYRDCFGIPAPTSVTVYVSSASCGFNQTQYTMPAIPGTGQEITYLCPSAQSTCTGGPTPGIQKWQYEVAVTLSGQCADWIFYVTDCCRNAAITTLQNPGADNLYLEARLNNLVTDNSSPQFSNDPRLFLCVGQEFHFNNGMIDPDGDSLVYSLISPRTDANTNVLYMPGYSTQFPLSSFPFPFLDPYTGDFIVHSTAQEVGVIVFLVQDYRNGELMGSVLRDVNVYATSCINSNPTITGINGTTQQSAPVLPGTSLCFDIFCDDADAGDSVTMEWNNGIPGAFFSSSGGVHPTGVFCWTPTLADVRPQPYLFTVTVRDNNCPINGSDMFSYLIFVSLDSSYINVTSEHPWNSYSGNIYWDSNSNGIKDGAEVSFPGMGIKMLPEDITMFANFNGDYSLFSWFNQSHTISTLPPADWIITSDSVFYTVNDTIDHTGLDFGINALNSYNYIDVNLSAANPRCNNLVSYWITYENTGTTLANGRVIFVVDSATIYNSSIPAPDLITGDSLIYYFTNLFPFTSNQVHVRLLLPGPGDTLNFAVFVEYDSLGTYYTCGEQALQQIVVCSCDPNDKTVLPEGILADHRTLSTETLLYTIRFQNTGTDTAFTVFIQDFIDPAFDLNTFHVTGSSHPMNTTIYPNRMVEFRFENILLPDSGTNELESHGFVQFEILPYTNLSLPVTVENTAGIFFDSNMPVITNTVRNTLVSELYVGITYPAQSGGFSIVFPNPFENQAEILLDKSFKDSDLELRVMNEMGALVLTQNSNNTTIKLFRGKLLPGIYFYEVKNKEGNRAVGKFLIR